MAATGQGNPEEKQYNFLASLTEDYSACPADEISLLKKELDGLKNAVKILCHHANQPQVYVLPSGSRILLESLNSPLSCRLNAYALLKFRTLVMPRCTDSRKLILPFAKKMTISNHYCRTEMGKNQQFIRRP